jgi:hypothetical protein
VLLSEAIEVAGADMLRMVERADADRAAADAYNAHLWACGSTHAFEVLNQRADEFLRRAARRERSAQALQLVIDAARKAATEETHHASS